MLDSKYKEEAGEGTYIRSKCLNTCEPHIVFGRYGNLEKEVLVGRT